MVDYNLLVGVQEAVKGMKALQRQLGELSQRVAAIEHAPPGAPPSAAEFTMPMFETTDEVGTFRPSEDEKKKMVSVESYFFGG